MQTAHAENGAVCVGFVQPLECLVLFSEGRINHRHRPGRNISLFRETIQSVEYSPGFGVVTRHCAGISEHRQYIGAIRKRGIGESGSHLTINYGIVNKPAGLEILGQAALSHFQSNYRQSIEEMIAQDRCRRESQWTESIAVGSPKFLLQLQQDIPWRRRFETEPFSTESWALRETSPAWNA